MSTRDESTIRALRAIFTEIADDLASAKSPWDQENVDGEAAFFGINDLLSWSIRKAIRRLDGTTAIEEMRNFEREP